MGMPKVLLVEDEPAIMDLLVDMLEDEGYDVAVAANGREGWQRLVETKPDVVLSDVMMPLVDGRELCSAINRDPQYRATPVVLMSAAREDICRRGCECAGFVPKPFELDQVVDILEIALRSARAAA